MHSIDQMLSIITSATIDVLPLEDMKKKITIW